MELIFIIFVVYSPIIAFFTIAIFGKRIATSIKQNLIKLGIALKKPRAVFVYGGLGISIMANNINYILMWNTVMLMTNIIPITIGVLFITIAYFNYSE